jgi:hypothetical protein
VYKYLHRFQDGREFSVAVPRHRQRLPRRSAEAATDGNSFFDDLVESGEMREPASSTDLEAELSLAEKRSFVKEALKRLPEREGCRGVRDIETFHSRSGRHSGLVGSDGPLSDKQRPHENEAVSRTTAEEAVMNCKSFEALIALNAEGDLDPSRAKNVESHLKSCASCQRFVKELEASQAVVKELAAESLDPASFNVVRQR